MAYPSPRKRKVVLALALASIFAGLPQRAHALELVMFDADWCGICKRFIKEVYPEYRRSAIGKRMPFSVADMKEQKDLAFELGAKITEVPVFVIVDKGVEVARFIGYSTPADFWANLRRHGRDHIAGL